MIQLDTPYVPESLGYDSSRLDVLHHFFQGQIDKKVLIGASYAITREGKLFAAGAIGKQSFREEDKRPLKPDTIFRIYSITKLFTAVAVFKLVEDGLCRLDETMKTWLPEMDTEDFSKVTIAHALSHTGGLPVAAGVYPLKEGELDCRQLIEQEFQRGGRDWITAALKKGRESEPGTRWEYSSLGMILLGVLIERITGVRAERYIEENILRFCGMPDSGFWDTMKNRSDIADRLFIQFEDTEKELNNPDQHSPWEAVPGTAGHMFSTVADLANFGNMLLNGGRLDGRRVLGRIAVEKMTSVYTKPHIKSFCWQDGGRYKPYGLGSDLGLEDFYLITPGTYHHEGWGRSRLSVDPEKRFVSAYFVPFVEPDVWDPIPSYNTQAIISSGLI
ncbi:MAG: beta-lactamase family protein [Oscillospiraceae bacterium]|nr:beta-lactamase family protein [Oscillospiraceae bacterium]